MENGDPDGEDAGIVGALENVIYLISSVSYVTVAPLLKTMVIGAPQTIERGKDASVIAKVHRARIRFMKSPPQIGLRLTRLMSDDSANRRPFLRSP